MRLGLILRRPMLAADLGNAIRSAASSGLHKRVMSISNISTTLHFYKTPPDRVSSGDASASKTIEDKM